MSCEANGRRCAVTSFAGPRSSVSSGLRSSVVSAGSTVVEHFPMMVVPVTNVLSLDLLLSHEHMSLQNRLERVIPAAAPLIIFASHQWLSRRHPDPNGVQLRTLKHFLQMGIEGNMSTLFLEGEWKGFVMGTKTSACRNVSFRDEIANMAGLYNLADAEQALAEDLARAAVWIDYACVPQDAAPGDDSQLRAINSIPYYVQQSALFVVVAPETRHQDSNMLCSFETWRNRGWCRLEEWTHLLSNGCMSAAVVLTEDHAYPIDITDYFVFRGFTRAGAVGLGNFSCCQFGHMLGDVPIPCDRDLVMEVLKDMWSLKVDIMAQEQNRFALWHFRCCETQLFAKSLHEPYRAAWGAPDDDKSILGLALYRMDEDSRKERIHGSAIHAACTLGDERLMRMCIDRGDDPFKRAQQGSCLSLACLSGNLAAVEYLLSLPAICEDEVNYASGVMGITALRRGAGNGHAAIVKALLQREADPSIKSASGQAPLHIASAHGHVKVVLALLAAGAPVNACDESGATALHFAASFTHWGSKVEKVNTIRFLLRHTASTDIRDSYGLSAADIAQRDGNHAAVLMLTGECWVDAILACT